MFGSTKDMMGDEPPYLAVGTEVSAKYKGAFCEAKIRKVVRSVKCKVILRNGQGTITVPDDHVRGTLRTSAVVEVKHPDRKELLEATIAKIQDCSQYTVVFDDGDITTLRRTALCLKSGRHFAESETLDQLPLTHPEHFSTPVIGGRRGRRNRVGIDESSDDEDGSRKSRDSRNEKEADIGRVVCVEGSEKKKQKDNWFPGLVVSPNAQDTVAIHVRDEYLVRSFKDGRYYTVPKKEATEFTRDIVLKVDSHTLKAAIEKALLFLDRDELPPHWDRDLLFGLIDTGNVDSDLGCEYDSSDDEPREEKDHFVAQLYKFMDDSGTPINKAPTISGKDVDLYRLFKVVQNLGGFNRVTNHNHWKTVSHKVGFGQTPVAINMVKNAYRRFLYSFEDFYRKLGCTMVNHPRQSRNRNRSGRSLIRDRDRASLNQNREQQKEKEKTDNPTVVPSTSTATDVVVPDINIKVEVKEEPIDTDEVFPVILNVKEKPATKRNSTVDSVPPVLIKIKEEKKDLNEVPLEQPKEAKKEKPKLRKSKNKNLPHTPAATTIPIPSPLTVPSVPTSNNKKNESKEKDKDASTKEEKKKKIFSRCSNKREKIPRITKASGIANTRQKRTLKENVKAIVDKLKIKTAKCAAAALGLDTSEKVTKVKVKEDSTSASKSKKDDNSVPSHEEKKKGRRRKDRHDGSDDIRDGMLPTYKSIAIGDKLKVFYGPTLESKVTYEAKVINAKGEGPDAIYLVHYTGWNNRYDEWIKHSRIADNLSWVPGRSPRINQIPKTRRRKSSSKNDAMVVKTEATIKTEPTSPQKPDCHKGPETITRSTTPSSVASSSSRRNARNSSNKISSNYKSDNLNSDTEIELDSDVENGPSFPIDILDIKEEPVDHTEETPYNESMDRKNKRKHPDEELLECLEIKRVDLKMKEESSEPNFLGFDLSREKKVVPPRRHSVQSSLDNDVEILEEGPSSVIDSAECNGILSPGSPVVTSTATKEDSDRYKDANEASQSIEVSGPCQESLPVTTIKEEPLDAFYNNDIGITSCSVKDKQNDSLDNMVVSSTTSEADDVCLDHIKEEPLDATDNKVEHTIETIQLDSGDFNEDEEMEDVYEFKEPEPFEFEVMKSSEDKKRKYRKSTIPSLKLFSESDDSEPSPTTSTNGIGKDLEEDNGIDQIEEEMLTVEENEETNQTVERSSEEVESEEGEVCPDSLTPENEVICEFPENSTVYTEVCASSEVQADDVKKEKYQEIEEEFVEELDDDTEDRLVISESEESLLLEDESDIYQVEITASSQQADSREEFQDKDDDDTQSTDSFKLEIKPDDTEEDEELDDEVNVAIQRAINQELSDDSNDVDFMVKPPSPPTDPPLEKGSPQLEGPKSSNLSIIASNLVIESTSNEEEPCQNVIIEEELDKEDLGRLEESMECYEQPTSKKVELMSDPQSDTIALNVDVTSSVQDYSCEIEKDSEPKLEIDSEVEDNIEVVCSTVQEENLIDKKISEEEEDKNYEDKIEEEDHNIVSLLCEETIPGSPNPQADCYNQDQAEEEVLAEPESKSDNTKEPDQETVISEPPSSSGIEKEAAPVMDNTPPTTPESTISSILASPREERSPSSPTLDNESTKSHRDSEIDLDNYSVPKDQSDDEILKPQIETHETRIETSRQIGRKKGRKRRKCSEEAKRKFSRTLAHGSESDTSEYSVPVANRLEEASHPLRPCKYNFILQLAPDMETNHRIHVLQHSMQEVRKAYAKVKSELASIDRRRKKIRRRERENAAAVAASTAIRTN